jgi:trk system potassium uptake protein TrkA
MSMAKVHTMNMIVVGCGRVGSELAFHLFEQGHAVTVIDNDPAAFLNLSPDFRGRTMEGEVLNRDVLLRAGIENAHGLATVTNSDSVNAVVGHVAQEIFNVPNVIVRNYDPRWRVMHEAFGHQVVSPTDWGAQRIEELLYQREMTTVFSAGNGEVEIYEFNPPVSWLGRTLSDVLDRNAYFPVAVTRSGRAMLPAADLVLEGGDVIHLSATMEGMQALLRQVGGK